MRVAMISDFPLNHQFVPGGVCAVAHYLTKGLARIPDLDLHVICCDPMVAQDTCEERDGATVHFLHSPRRFSQSTNFFFPRRRIAKIVHRIRPDLLHGQGLGLQAAAATDHDLPHAVTLHGVIWKERAHDYPSLIGRLRGKFHAHLAYRQMLKLHNVFVISGYAAKMLPEDGNYRQFLINNPVGEEIFRIENKPRQPHVLVVGGIRPRKDPLTAIKVMERVLQEIPQATMHLLGPSAGTPLDQEIATYVESRQLGERVKVLGLVPDEVLWEEYEKASVLLMTSLEETAPVALSEAFAVGLPAVGTEAGGIPFMIREGETGFVRPIKDVEALSGRVLAILRDDNLRSRLAATSREIGRTEYALEPIARKTYAAYEEILGA
jgi:glycosyltransferase involved in cell wall biosynthesis